MDSMKINISSTINNIYFESFYSQVNDISPPLNTLVLDFTKQNKPTIVPLIPLAESSRMCMDFNVKLTKLYVDVFDKGNHDCLVQNFSRLLLIFEELSVDSTTLSLGNMYIFLLNNFQFTHRNITNQNELFCPKQHISCIQKNNSYLQRIGYMELFRLSTVKLLISIKKQPSEKNSIIMEIDSIEFNTCEDGIYCLGQIINFLSTQINQMITDVLPPVIKPSNKSTTEINNSSQTISLNASKSSSKEFTIQQDYFKVKKNNNTSSTQISNKSTVDNNTPLEVSTVVTNDNEEGGSQVHLDEIEGKISLHFIKCTLYEGRDFDFDSQHNDITNVPLDTKEDTKKQTSSAFASLLQIDNNYFKKKRNQLTSTKEINERVRRTKRKIRDNISFVLSNLQINMNRNENQTDLLSVEIQIDNLEVEDNIPQSKYSKLFSRYNYNERDTFLSLKLSISTFEKKQYISFDYSLTPINILIDNNSLSFIIKCFKYDPFNNFEVVEFEDLSISDNKANQNDLTSSKSMEAKLIEEQKQMSLHEESQSQSQNEEQEQKQLTQDNQIYFTHIFIKDLFINVSFTNHKYIPNISNFQIHIQQYYFTGNDEYSKKIGNMVIFYIKSVLKQIPSTVFHSISFFRPFALVVDSAFDLLKQPYHSFMSGKGVARGIGKGVKRFFFGVTGETLFVFEKTAAVLQHKFFGRENNTMLGKNSYYKRWIYLGDKKKKQYEEYFHKK